MSRRLILAFGVPLIVQPRLRRGVTVMLRIRQSREVEMNGTYPSSPGGNLARTRRHLDGRSPPIVSKADRLAWAKVIGTADAERLSPFLRRRRSHVRIVSGPPIFSIVSCRSAFLDGQEGTKKAESAPISARDDAPGRNDGRRFRSRGWTSPWWKHRRFGGDLPAAGCCSVRPGRHRPPHRSQALHRPAGSMNLPILAESGSQRRDDPRSVRMML